MIRKYRRRYSDRTAARIQKALLPLITAVIGWLIAYIQAHPPH